MTINREPVRGLLRTLDLALRQAVPVRGADGRTENYLIRTSDILRLEQHLADLKKAEGMS